MDRENSVSSFNGVHYFSRGWKLVRMPGIRRFVVIPLLVNIVILGAPLHGCSIASVTGSPR